MSDAEISSTIDVSGLDLDPAQARKLLEMIDHRLAAQERELSEAVDRALAVVPRLLRGPIKKVLGL